MYTNTHLITVFHQTLHKAAFSSLRPLYLQQTWLLGSDGLWTCRAEDIFPNQPWTSRLNARVKIKQPCAVSERYTDMSNRRQMLENKRSHTGACWEWCAPGARHFHSTVNTWVSRRKHACMHAFWGLGGENISQNVRLDPNLELLIFHVLTDHIHWGWIPFI